MAARRKLAVLAIAVGVLAVACDPVRVSVSTSGTQGDGTSSGPSLSADATVVAFTSDAHNLVAGDTNGAADVFVRDLAKGTTQRASVASDGHQANSASAAGELSSNGRYVAFVSYATNLVANGPTGGTGGVYVHDRQTGSTVLASRGAGGTPLQVVSLPIAVSATGRFVAFIGATGVVRYDATTGVTAPVLDSFTIIEGISSDGRYLATDTFTATGVHSSTSAVVDLATGTDVFRGPTDSTHIRMTSDHRYVVYAFAPNCFPSFMPACTSGPSGVNVRDLSTGTETPVLRAVGQPYVAVDSLDVSGDGRRVALGIAGNVYRFDRRTDTFTLVTIAPDGSAADGTSGEVRINADGAVLAFRSGATNLVTNDTNGVDDVFARRP